MARLPCRAGLVLIYKIEGGKLILGETGTHSDLFGHYYGDAVDWIDEKSSKSGFPVGQDPCDAIQYLFDMRVGEARETDLRTDHVGDQGATR